MSNPSTPNPSPAATPAARSGSMAERVARFRAGSSGSNPNYPDVPATPAAPTTPDGSMKAKVAAHQQRTATRATSATPSVPANDNAQESANWRDEIAAFVNQEQPAT
jgi:hypothetical protein